MNVNTNWWNIAFGGNGIPGAGDDAHFNLVVTGPVTGTLTPQNVQVGDGWGGVNSNTGDVDLLGDGTTIQLAEWGFLQVGHDDVGGDGDAVVGDLTIGTGAIISGDAFGSVGWNDGTTGTVTVDAASLVLSKQVDVGRDGGSGTVNVLNGSSLTGGAMYVGSGADADTSGGWASGLVGVGSLTVDATSSLTLNGWTYESTFVDKLAIGLSGGTGSARIDGTATVGDILVDWDNFLGDGTGSLAVGTTADIDGNLLTLGKDATLAFDLGEAESVGDFDLAGAVTVDGVLDLDALTGSLSGTFYELVTGSSVTGTFDSVYYEGSLVTNPTDWGAIGGYRIEYTDTSVRLAVPEPATGGLVVLSLAGLSAWLRRRR